MQIQTTTEIMYLVKLSADELAEALVDPSALQAQLRDARAAQRIATDTRTNHVPVNADRLRSVNAEEIATAAKKQNKKTGTRFLATGAATHSCEFCAKTFQTSAILNRHKGRMHKTATESQPIAHAADDASGA